MKTGHDLVDPIRAALYDYDAVALRSAIEDAFAPNAPIHLAHPFETLTSPDALYTDALAPLQAALPDLERRDYIVIEGVSPNTGKQWIGCGGYYTGRFFTPFLDILPTGHQVSMRFHEFYEIKDGKICEFQALWDIPELMMQSGSWPMSPSLGREWHVPAPATQDGNGPHKSDGKDAVQLVSNMLAGLSNHKDGGVTAMRLEDYWHSKFSWYGPSGIGTSRGIQGFRDWHQIPFLNAMPDRVGSVGKGNLFGQGDFVGFTAWPGMHMSVSDNGFLGIAPSDKKITMRSLDFWRCEKGTIRENWVLVDLLDVYNQLGVNVFERMRELNKARAPYHGMTDDPFSKIGKRETVS